MVHNNFTVFANKCSFDDDIRRDDIKKNLIDPKLLIGSV